MANGKGDTPRPLSVSKDEFDAAWARTFGTPRPTRTLADPATCAHWNKVFTTDDAPRCSDCGAALELSGAGGT